MHGDPRSRSSSILGDSFSWVDAKAAFFSRTSSKHFLCPLERVPWPSQKNTTWFREAGVRHPYDVASPAKLMSDQLQIRFKHLLCYKGNSFELCRTYGPAWQKRKWLMSSLCLWKLIKPRKEVLGKPLPETRFDGAKRFLFYKREKLRLKSNSRDYHSLWTPCLNLLQ